MSTRGTSILSPFTSLRRACRDIWNKRAESLITVDAAVVVLHGTSSIHEPDIKAHGVPLYPSPERRYPSILRKLFYGASSKRDKTATGIDAETELGAYRCMLLFEARYQTRMDIPRRIRRKLEPLLAEEIEYQRKLAAVDDWTSRIAAPANQANASPIRIPISVPNTGPETVSIRNARSAVATLSPSPPPMLLLPSTAAVTVTSAPELESLQPPTPSANHEEQPEYKAKTLKPYTYARPNMKRVKMIALFLSTTVKTDEPWKREHIIYPNREPYELPPGMRGSKRPITSSKRVWELSRKTRRFALQKLGFLINAFLFVPTLSAIPEADE